MVDKEFWKGIVYKDGKLNEEQVFRELSDYSFLMEQASKVYCAVANLSKTNYYAGTIISELEERWLDKAITQDDIKMFIEESKTLEDLIDSLKDYFELK